ncbi:MAG: S8 family serine peptidase, partial [Akkermansiaceae bacterium]|nr:S8 family serine peptidase [Akkermansiaceae bacterium]
MAQQSGQQAQSTPSENVEAQANQTQNAVGESSNNSADQPKQDPLYSTSTQSGAQVLQSDESKRQTTVLNQLPKAKPNLMDGKVGDVLNDPSINWKKPEERAQAVLRMKEIEDRNLEKAKVVATQLGEPLRQTLANGRLRELVGIDEGGELLYYEQRNNNAAISTGVDQIQVSPFSLDGAGLLVGVWDGGSVLSTHQEFNEGASSRVNIRDGAASDYHATHVGGTIAAAGVVANAKGMAPAAIIESYQWSSDTSEMTAAAATATGQFDTKIYLSNHSYGYSYGWRSDGQWIWTGTGTDENAYDADFGQYSSKSRDLDSVVFNAPYYLIFWAGGNENNDGPSNGSTCTIGGSDVTYNSSIHPQNDGDYSNGFDTIGDHGVAKNLITIGASNDAVSGGVRTPSNGTITSFSSTGPVDDGRIKPDLVANGASLYSSDNGNDTDYRTMSGTSMASPNATGSAALLVELYRELFSGSSMRASTLKALLIQTATDVGIAGPDYTYGWGYIDVKTAADLLNDTATYPEKLSLVEDQITTSTTTQSYNFFWDGSSAIRATLCWTDPSGTSNGNYDSDHDNRTPDLVNNLNLKLIAPDNTEYFPFVMPFVGTWTVASMSQPATTGVNNVDNVEQILLQSPGQTGEWTVEVSYTGSLTNSAQDFGLIVSGADANPAGLLTFANNGEFSVDEDAGTATITVERANGSEGAVSVNYATSNGSATAGSEYTAASGTLSWADGNAASKTFTVTIADDSVDEISEQTVLITLSNPSGTAITGTNPATLTINDDDNAAPSVDAGSDDIVYLASSSAPAPVAGAYFKWDPASDTGGDNVWGSSTANTFDWTLPGSLSPITIADPWFDELSKAYAFPAAEATGGSWDGYGSSQPATFEFVIKTDGSTGSIFEAGGSGDGLQVDILDGVLRGTVQESTPARATYTLSPIDKIKYIHVVFVVDNANNVVQLYVDGALKDEQPWTAGEDWAGTDGGSLGSVNGTAPTGGVTDDFTGEIGLVRFYQNKAFDASEVVTNYDSLSSDLSVSVSLDGTVTDSTEDLSVMEYLWTVVDGPEGSVVDFADPTAVDTNVTFSTNGTYTLRLTADDGTAQVSADVEITVGVSGISLVIQEASISENGGSSNATLIREDTSGDLTVTLSSSDTTEVTVPVSVTISNGQATANFTVTAQNDAILDGTQAAIITASASGLSDTADTIEVTDSESTVVYDGNGSTAGSPPTDGNAYEVGASVTVLGQSTLSNLPYLFGGWNTAADGSGTTYAESATFAISSNTTLYALWVPGPLTIYEPFAQAAGDLNSKAGGVGLSGNWNSGADADVITTPTMTYGNLPNESGQVDLLNSSGNDAWITTNTDLANNNLLDDGATLWFSFVFQKTSGGGGNEHSGFAFGTERVDGAYNGTQMTNSGYGLGYYSRNDSISVATWNASGSPSVGDSLSLTYSTPTFIVGKIEWGASSGDVETITLYTPSLSDLGTLGTGVTKTVAGFDQTLLDTISFTQRNSGGTQSYDELRFGSTYESVIGQGSTAYSVTYNGNGSDGGAVPVDANEYDTDDPVTVLGNTASLTKTGYTFDDWNTAADGSGTDYAADDTFSMASSNVTLYAQWAAVPTYTVAYHANGATSGTKPSDQTKTQGVDLTLASNSGGLVQSGYTFAGWNTESNGTGTSYTEGGTYSANVADTLYAQWTVNTYTVAYHGNTNTGGSAPSDQSKTHGVDLTISAVGTLTKTGHSFSGWNTAADGGGDSYASEGTYSANAATTLYAQWSPDTYTVTFNANGGGSPSPSSKIVTYDSTYGTLASISRTGYTFMGWFTSGAGGSEITSATTVAITSNQTIYAQWNEKPVVNAGSDQPVYMTGSDADWTPADATAVAWYDASDSNNVVLSGQNVTNWKDISGNGYDLNQSPTDPVYDGSQINGLNVIHFSDTSAELYRSGISDINCTELCVISVGMPKAAGDYPNLGSVYSTDLSDKLFLRLQNNDASGRINSGLKLDGGNNISMTSSYSPEIVDDAPVMFAAYYDGLNGVSSVNGGALTKTVNVADGATFTINEIQVGRDNNTPKNYQGEMVVLNTSDLTTIQKIEGYLAWKWGMQAKLPAAHPYSTTNATSGPKKSVPLATVTLAGTVMDTDDTPSVTWLDTGTGTGTGIVTFADVNDLNSDVSFSGSGTYILRLIVDDGHGPVYEEVVITVSDPTPYSIWAGGVQSEVDGNNDGIDNGLA